MRSAFLLSLAIGWGILGGAAGAPGRPAPHEQDTPRRRALLVGVEAYAKTVGWPALEGPRADVRALRRALVERAGFRPADIAVLLDERATHQGILDAFRGLIERADPGDLLLVYFSGHGSQLLDQNGDEAADGYDETLVPFDAVVGSGKRNDIRDDAIAELVRLANRKTSRVVLVFDCCNSGTTVRGKDPRRIRWVPGPKRGIKGKRESRPVEASQVFVPEDLSYVYLGACRSIESAAEIRIPGPGGKKEIRGAFTYALVQQLYHMEPGWSYADLMDRVRERIRESLPAQTPVIDGRMRGRPAFAGGAVPQEPYYLLEGGANGFFLRAGLVHGLRAGTILDVGPGNAAGRREATLGRIRIREARAITSRVEWLGAAPPRRGDGLVHLRAFERESAPGDTRMRVALQGAAAAPDGGKALLERLRRESNLTPGDARTAQFVIRTERGKGSGSFYRLAGPDGTALPLGARADSPRELDRFVRQLAGLGRAHRIASVRNDKSPTLRIEVEPFVCDGKEAEPKPLGKDRRGGDGATPLPEGQIVSFRIRNRSPTAVWVSLIVISPDGQISMPWCTPEDEPVPPGGWVPTPRWSLSIPPGDEAFYRCSTERFRFVASSRPPRGLESIAQPPVTQGETRGLTLDEEPPGFNGKDPIVREEWLTRTIEFRTIPKQGM